MTVAKTTITLLKIGTRNRVDLMDSPMATTMPVQITTILMATPTVRATTTQARIVTHTGRVTTTQGQVTTTRVTIATNPTANNHPTVSLLTSRRTTTITLATSLTSSSLSTKA